MNGTCFAACGEWVCHAAGGGRHRPAWARADGMGATAWRRRYDVAGDDGALTGAGRHLQAGGLRRDGDEACGKGDAAARPAREGVGRRVLSAYLLRRRWRPFIPPLRGKTRFATSANYER